MENTEKSAFERVQSARHPERPYTDDLLANIFEDFIELRGDRRYADDSAIICGFARLGDFEVAVIGQQKGRDTNQRRFRNFGMPKPEGYRKALRVMKLAEKYSRPLITFIDTPGAYPGIDAEERGQAEAIAFNLREMANLKISTIVVVLGEGGSGGALAIGVGDRILMLENSVYSVISPEGCAAILWKDSSKANLAAESLRLTATDLKSLGLIDEIVSEETLWRMNSNSEDTQDTQTTQTESENFRQICETLKNSLIRNLRETENLDADERINRRYRKFRNMGEWIG